MKEHRKRPLIGIAGHGYDVPRPFGTLPVHGAPRTYATAVRASGGLPVIVPPGAGVELLDVLDGLVLTGGGDIDPARYGGRPGSAIDVDPARDDDEIELVRAAAAAGVPVLGACRGLQVLVVAFGGTLRTDVDHQHPAAGHAVTTAPGSIVGTLIGAAATTSALHHQAVEDPGPTWVPTAWAGDGVIEAVEPRIPGWPVLGVQWHPEMSWNEWPHDPTGPAIFGWLVATAEKRSTRTPVPS
ncbi:gamma-glutamyl-gamma-aminobutyrate hydrolase family protein [Nocardioides sp. WS12]|uniref:gamma-glutamyl-gamma-aminobutyrate hydrolase family protein n=1 Tax=Nocardioides sp. WS12 TaxID=2486272 RepID=UPI0015FA6F82|nr:gamma-glutamyl-gamma-aminobutyrate hydrolase family protein [Nocardioides sp. WS12]